MLYCLQFSPYMNAFIILQLLFLTVSLSSIINATNRDFNSDGIGRSLCGGFAFLPESVKSSDHWG